MSLSLPDRQPCSKCGFRGWVFSCDGCQASFCVKHAPDHRVELSAQLANIQQQYDHLHHIYNQHEEVREHPLFSQINVWEQDAIAKIQQTAKTTRDELRQLLDEANHRMKTIFNVFNGELRTGRENDHYTEIELDIWKEKLINIRKQLETPCNIELITDTNSPPIHLIKINALEENITTTNPSFSQSSQVDEVTNNIECSCDEDLNKPQSTILDISETCAAEELNEPSTMPKEEIDSCDLLSNEPYLSLDPTKNHHLLLLQLSPTNQSQLSPILNELTDHNLQIFNQKENCLDGLKCSEQATIFIDISTISPYEQNGLLDNISELDNVHFIYIRGTPSDDNDEREQFFQRYPKIKAMLENEQPLMVQWAMDTVNEYKKAGDMYIDTGDKDKGRKCFEQGITLYKRLSDFLNKKRCVR